MSVRFLDTSRCACTPTQVHRYGARVSGPLLDRIELSMHCRLDSAGEKLLHATVRHFGLSARAYHRVLRVARTIADLAGSECITAVHIAEAAQYRSASLVPRAGATVQ